MSKLSSGIPINELFIELQQRAISEIKDLDPDYIAANDDEKILAHFMEKYSVEIPVIDESNIYMDEPKEIRSIGVYAGNPDVLLYHIHIPFTGDERLFSYTPSSSRTVHNGVSPRIENNEIVISFSGQLDKPNAADEMYSQEVDSIKHNLRSAAHDISIYLQNLRAPLLHTIQTRRESLKQKSELIGSLKIPIKRSSDQPPTFHVPEVRRKPSIELKKASTSMPSAPEPTLDEAEYEHILKIINDMSLVIERSPTTYSKMQETELRDIFLVQLNGHYEGNATGETFNGLGKTDILIRHENSNIFIAECKFWSGQVGLIEAIDQLLGYTTWRDTKTSLILFNKGRDLTTITKQINSIVESHPNYKSHFKLQDSALNNGTTFGYKLKHPQDVDKEIFLSILIFQVSSK